MRRTIVTAVAAAVSALAVAGCAQPSASPAASITGTAREPAAASSTTASAAASTAGRAACAATRPLAAGVLTLTTADNGKTLCLRTGTAVTILLRGTPGGQWTPIRSSSAVLVPRADPRMMLQRGVTGAAFRAARPGVTTVTSARYPCQNPAAAGSGTAPPVHCGAIIAFRVTVAVS